MNVCSHKLFILASDAFGKVAIRPEAVSPEKLFQLRVFSANDIAGSALQHLHDFGDAFPGIDLDQEVYMIALDAQFVYMPIVDLTGLQKKLFQSDGYFA